MKSLLNTGLFLIILVLSFMGCSAGSTFAKTAEHLSVFGVYTNSSTHVIASQGK
ncbi:MAG: hypothetical protein LBK43_05330 [Treponema sp.]|jgi:hypothetical protein|nr:hypothetical protein [Treponema sp.]